MDNKEKRNVAIIVGAGNGTRFGLDKIFIEIENKPVWYYSARAFQLSEKVDEIIMVVKEERINQILDKKKIFGLNKMEKVVVGGNKRKDSVIHALNEINSDRTNLVLIHDAARPLVSIDLIERCMDEAEKYGAAVPGILLRDTFKKGNDFVEDTLNREEFKLIQTPQVFKQEIIVRAYENAAVNNVEETDDSSLVEKLGHRVRIVQGQESNLKITYPGDLDLVSFLMTRHWQDNNRHP